MKAVVTGANGFLGRNLVVALRRASIEIAGIGRDTAPADWSAAVQDATAVFHLAGVNRPQHENEFVTGNVGSLDRLLAALDESASGAPPRSRPIVVLSSSTQAAQDNPYGRSKFAAEQALERYSARTGTPAAIYRLPGVFGKWSRPNYNSVVSTFCHNIARDLPITISDPARVVELVHCDDVVAQFMTHLDGRPAGVVRGEVGPVFTTTLGGLAERIRGFRAVRDTLLVPELGDPFTHRLLGTYTSYLPADRLAYGLEQRTDPRGTLAELLRSRQFGQIFVSRTHPGITRGNHFHDLKVEKFCVLEGDAVIRFRPILGDEITEHRVSGTDFKVVDIPPGMTHSIENVGATEMIVLFWASEILDQQRPDTHSLEVQRG
jgi:UDP-2-acetamido-2,6-beta-L-arabino-hexul-4-ose reductase